MNVAEFVSELRRRRVLRVAGMYLIAAWAAIQVADVVFPRLGLPDWLVTLVIVLAVIALPVVLVLSWVFDFTGGRLERTAPTLPHARSPRLLIGATAALAVVVLVSAVWVTNRLNHQTIERLAVLPLDNISGDTAQAILAGGMTRSLIEVLTEAGAPVISYRSVAEYAAGRRPLPEIAKELGVEGIITGSVRQSGDRVEVSVELVEAASQQARWAQTFVQSAADVLTMQREIASRIVRQINAHIDPRREARLAAPQPVNPAAYAEWQLGRAEAMKWTAEGFRAARAHLERAVATDSLFAPAWAELALVTMNAQTQGYVSLNDARPVVQRAAARALAIDSTAGLARIALGLLHLNSGDDLVKAERELRLGVRLSREAIAYDWLGWVLFCLGRGAEAVAVLDSAVTMDPRNAQMRLDLVVALWSTGQVARVETQLDSAIALDPRFAEAYVMRSWLNSLRGQHQPAIEDAQRAEVLKGEERWPALRAFALAKAGRTREARQALAELDSLRARPNAAGPGTLYSFEVPAWVALADTARALGALEKAVSSGEPYALMMINLPLLQPIRASPRFQAARARALGVS